ncbi:hypothetical protein [Marinomonas posidonica]|uniref:hypothetical protein n=1 Tax=Marinomonas posidonica TaxID=936476 RepID=UPI00373561F8
MKDATKADQLRQQATKRQQEKRAKDKARNQEMGLKEIRIQLSRAQLADLKELRRFRGGYDVNEYIATLIRRDKQRMETEQAQLGQCQFCQKALPKGCNKHFKGHGQCFFTREEKKLRL